MDWNKRTKKSEEPILHIYSRIIYTILHVRHLFISTRSLITDFYKKNHPELSSTMTQLLSIYALFFILSSTFYNFSLSISRMRNQLSLLMALQVIIMLMLQYALQYLIVYQLNNHYYRYTYYDEVHHV